MDGIRVVTWNSNGRPLKGKRAFLEILKGDLTAIPHCGCDTTLELAYQLGMPQSKVIVDERTNASDHTKKGYTIGAYVKLGSIEQVSFTLPKGYVAFLWHLSETLKVRCVATYSIWYPKPSGGNKGWVMHTWDTLSVCGDWLKSGPSLLLGDLNATCAYDLSGVSNRGQYRSKFDDEEVNYTRIIGRLRSLGLRSSWHKYNRSVPGYECQHTYAPARTHIDYIFVSKDFSIDHSKIVRRPNDHSAVVSDMKLLSHGGEAA